jgi:HTH-type transcriptional regulator / antitoxin HigA
MDRQKEPEPRTPEGDRFEVLGALVEAYENKHYPIEASDPVTAIEAHMQMADLPRKALIDVIGSASRASEILNRKRPLTLEMIHALNRTWRIPAEVLITPYHLAGERDKRKARRRRKAAA